MYHNAELEAWRAENESLIKDGLLKCTSRGKKGAFLHSHKMHFSATPKLAAFLTIKLGIRVKSFDYSPELYFYLGGELD